MAVDNRKKIIKKRIIVLTIGIIMILVLLMGNTAYIQFIRGEKLKTMALEQQTQEKEITPRRGTIYDRNGKELAVSANVETVIADPRVIKQNKNADQVADTLATVLNMDRQKIYDIISKNSSFQYVKKRIEADAATKIRSYISGKDANGNNIPKTELTGKDLTGITLIEDSKRYYPFGDFASHVLGFTGEDNQGLEGLESIYDTYLKGKSGKIVKSGATKGNAPFEYEQYYNAQDGDNLVLTIDETIQHFVEKSLDDAYIEQQAMKGACAIVMNPKTGEILAMATRPSFDLNAPRKITDPKIVAELSNLQGDEYNKKMSEELQKMWRNKAVVDTYEPGSTFKLITCATALEEKAATLEDVFNCPGYGIVGGRRISCWKPAGHGTETFMDGMVNSCNPVLMAVGARIGKESFYRYFKSFGFRETTGFDLPGEAVGVFHSYNDFNAVELATAAFGQGFTITPLQMITAVSALVNGGTMYTPRIVKEITDSNNHVIKSFEPNVIRQPISKETSDKMRNVLETVIIKSGSTGAVKGYRIGGKSGTSEKLPRGSGKYIASFIGVAPIDDPQIVCLIILDEPAGESYYGGIITAPVASKIMGEVLRYYGIEPHYTDEEMAKLETSVPNVVGKSLEAAKGALSGFSLSAKVVGTGDTVESQDPIAGSRVRQNSTITINTSGGLVEKVTVPDLVGKSSVDANTILYNAGLGISIQEGSDEKNSAIYKQEPVSGSIVNKGTVIKVYFQPRASD